MGGSWPLWDPFAAAGQPAFSDALNQLFLPPVVLLRMLPAVPGFNLLVAVPFPLAALGMYLLLRRRVSPTSATFGAIVFAVSGPIVSTGNFPNLSRSVAWIPWILWAADRDREAPSARAFGLLAATVACLMLSGEPATMIGALTLLVAYVMTQTESNAPAGAHVRGITRAVAAIVVAAMIAAVQIVPMALAASASPRSLMQADNFWSVHPLWLVEAVLPHVFGDTFNHYSSQLPWITPLNSGRDPFFYSLFIGPAALLLSVLGALWGPRRRRFLWLTVVVVGMIFAFGDYTPLYPMLQRIVPPLRSLRFPAKYLVFVSLGIAALAANGAEALQQWSTAPGYPAGLTRAVKATCAVALAVALALATLIALVLVAPFTGARAFYDLGIRVGVADPIMGAEYLFRAVPPIANVQEGRTLMMANLATAPAPWMVRELISYDLPQLWPIERARAVARFEQADRPERLRFLARGGVRYCLLPSPPYSGAQPLHAVGEQFGAMAVYECVKDVRRAYVVATASVVPDVTTQGERLFSDSFDAESTVMLERPAPGAAGVATVASARITIDAPREVAIEAAAGADGGYLVLLDTFDRSWRVDVDGQPAELLRANALYRAVHISPGPHTVRFRHRPDVLSICAIFSGAVAVALAVVAFTPKRR